MLQLPISGLVRLDGRPLSDRRGHFYPGRPQAFDGLASERPKFGMVAFRSRVGTGSGLSKYRIAVFSNRSHKRPLTPNNDSGKAESVASQVIPAKYSGLMTLEFEVGDPADQGADHGHQVGLRVTRCRRISNAIRTTIARNDGQSDAILARNHPEKRLGPGILIPRFLAASLTAFIACKWRASNMPISASLPSS